ncbi:MAG TPA: CAP domain-containing protein [Kofleriaceae bacterium]|nr:CAP domain-containing protein [Kofleriaceae bacterium]
MAPGPPIVDQRPGAPGRPILTPVLAPLDVPGGPVVFAPAGAAALRYNEPQPPAPHSPIADAVIAAVGDAAARAGVAIPQPDARLFRACTDLAELVPPHVAGGAFDDTAIAFALSRNGIIEPAVRLLFWWGDVEAPGQFVRELAPRLIEVLRSEGATRLGIGVAQRRADGTGAMVFALQGSAVSTLPIPRAVAPDGEVVIDATLEPRFHDPEVFVTFQAGASVQVDVAEERAGHFVARIACTHRGRQQIEITASNAGGSTVLANFPVWCGAEPAASARIDPVADDTPVESAEQAARYLAARINRDRAVAGLPALRWDADVAAVAQRHAEEMRRTGVVAHVSPITGSAVDRVRAARIPTGAVLENVALAHRLDEAHRALMNSPGHRANILSTMATHIGIGVAVGDEDAGRRALFIAQLFTRPSP